MSAVKHQPEHALPWKIDDAAEGNQFLHVCSAPRSACVAMSEDQGDADYIVRAANAYPKLIGALRSIESKFIGGNPETLRKIAAEILRDLGEAS